MNKNNKTRFIHFCLLLLSAIFTGGCATVQGPPNPDDPLESFNRAMFELNDTMDHYAFKPVAKGYNFVMPDFASKGVSNFYSNLDDIVVFFNQLLQFKLHAAAITSARFVFNSTFGVFGLIDVATYMDLPKRNEDFGQTLAVWGVPSGPYVVLPFIGPRTIRDSGALLVDWTYFDPVFKRNTLNQTIANLAIKYTDVRAGLLKASNILDESIPDRYAYVRDAWLLRRQYLIYDGNPPQQEDDFNEDELFDDEDLYRDEQSLESRPEAESTAPRDDQVVDKKILKETPIKTNMEITVKGYKPKGKKAAPQADQNSTDNEPADE